MTIPMARDISGLNPEQVLNEDALQPHPKQVNWRWPKRQHIQADTKCTRKSRAAFIGIALTQYGLLKKFYNAPWLCHKIMHEFGLN